MATRTTIFDRYAEQRLEREALERERAAQAAAEAAALALLPVEVPVTPMVQRPSSFDFCGFHFAFPGNYPFRDIDLTLDHQGEVVRLSIQRREVPESKTLAELFAKAVRALSQDHPTVRVVREREARIAGSPALALDYQFSIGYAQRHGRLVAALVPHADSDTPQWLAIGCVIDPNVAVLSGWLIEFDHMLDGLARV